VLKGPAGTSKTYLALALGIQALIGKDVGQIAIFRSAVEARSIGFLPGDVDGKLDPYKAPYIDLLETLSPKKNFRALDSAKELEFHSTSFLRGMTFDNTFMILDEFQNCNAHEIETVMTRVGEGSRLILCGDSGQSDLKGSEARERARAHARSDREHARVCDLRVHARRHRSFEIREEFLRRARGR
jgi:phosphate starvation-inducible PhoH-like protein